MQERLYELTNIFVRKYAKRYYYQYQGELADLTASIYSDFLYPKGREQEKSLLDLYDPEKSSFEYFIKVATIRKLIDYSRGDPPRETVSIDYYLDEFGQPGRHLVGLVTEDPLDSWREDLQDEEFKQDVKTRFLSLSEEARGALKREYTRVRASMESASQQFFDEVLSSLQTVCVSGKQEQIYIR